MSRHGEAASSCRLDRTLLESRVAAVVEAVEGEAFDLRAGVGDGKGTGARGEASGEVGIGVWHDSAETFAGDAGLADAEVRVGNAVVDTDRFSFRGQRGLKVIELHMVLANWARVISWDLERLTLALNGVVNALMGTSRAARLSKEVNRLISIFFDERFRLCIKVGAD